MGNIQQLTNFSIFIWLINLDAPYDSKWMVFMFTVYQVIQIMHLIIHIIL